VKISDLSRAELAEWIADWVVLDLAGGQLSDDDDAYRDAQMSIANGDYGQWYVLRNELLAAYKGTP